MDKMAIYNRLPIWGQNLACHFEGNLIRKKRYGGKFWQYLAEYESHNDWSYEQISDYRDARLRKMIHHCYNTVPYYTKLFNDGGINPNSVKTIDDLKVLPILTKETVKANIDTLTSTAIPKHLIKIHATSGTTGSGLSFKTTNSEEEEQWAVWWRYRRKHGIDVGTWCGNFGGKVIVPLSINKPPYWRTNRPCQQVFYSGYHISKNTSIMYANNIRKRGISWLHGYPTNLAELASYLVELGITIPLKWISISSENLYDIQSKQIEAAFGTKPLQHYGLTEGVANISQQPDGQLAVDEDFSCVEFLSDESGYYRIIGSSLTNFTMPLLRYDTGDYADISEDLLCINARSVKSLQGRNSEFVLLPNGMRIGPAALSLIFSNFSDIQATQIVQKSIDKVQVNIIPHLNSNMLKQREILSALRERLGHDICIEINFTNEISRTKNGKYRLVISSI